MIPQVGAVISVQDDRPFYIANLPGPMVCTVIALAATFLSLTQTRGK